LQDIGTYLIGTNSDYATDTDVIHETDEAAIIPWQWWLINLPRQITF
jgi:hypothetical protein